MAETETHALRPEAEFLPEQEYLEGRLGQIEKGLGQLAARAGTPTRITQPLDALDRARELVAEMHKQVRARPLQEALESRLAWLDRVEARRQTEDNEPKPEINRIALDRRLLADVLKGWQARS